MDTHTAYKLFVDPVARLPLDTRRPPRDPRADRLILATMVQESDISDRIQGPGDRGPARSFAQFEQIGVTDVLTRTRTGAIARLVCSTLAIAPTPEYVFNVMAWNDTLCVCFSRLNYWNSRLPLPSAEEQGWQCYQQTWRPGRRVARDGRAPGPKPGRSSRHDDAIRRNPPHGSRHR